MYEPYWDDEGTPYPNGASIDQAIKSGFLCLDSDIIDSDINSDFSFASKALGRRQAKFLNRAISLLAPGYAGSCALLSIYDSSTKLLRVACVGNSRAVLGRRNLNGTYSTIALSVDQTAKGNEEEIKRIHAEHPREPNVIKEGRLLGIKGKSATLNLLWRGCKEL